MSNTSSNKTNKTNQQTVKVIVGEIGRDTKTGILGRGYSYDNGATFHVTDTMFGRLYDKDDGERMWPNMAHKVADEIKSATADLPNVRKQADEAVKFAESAIAASKVNSDAIVAQSEAISEAKAAADSAAAEIQQTKANAASDVAAIKQGVADMQTEINTAKSANEEAVKSAQADVAKAQSEVDQVKDNLAKVSSDLDTYAKSAAEQGHDITVIKQKQGQYEADYASVNGKVNQLQADTDGLRENIKDNQGNIASLQTSASQASIELENAKSQVAKLQLTADGYKRTFADQGERLSKVEQTATEHTTEIADAKGNLSKVSQKVDSLAGTFTNAEKDINNIKLDVKGLHDTLTGQGNQLASLNVTLNSLDSKYSGITGDLQSKQTALSTEQQQTKDMLLRKADKSEVDNVKGTVSKVSAEQKVMADQISSKVSSADYQKDKTDTITAIEKNSTAIDETNKLVSIKADKTEVNNLNNTAQQLSARLNVMAGQVQSKVDETKVNNLIDGRGFATQSTVQSLIDQRAGTLSESITGLETKFSNSSSINLAEKTNQGVTNWQCDPGNGATNLTEININGARGVRFNNTKKSTSWWVAKYPLNLDFFEPNTDYIVTFDIRTSTTVNSQPFLQIAQGDSSHQYFADADTGKSNFPANQLVHVSIVKHTNDTLDRNAETFYLNSLDLGNCDWVDIVNFKIARGTIDKGYSAAPSDNATVTQLQSVTASIDGLQSNVTNFQNNTNSQFTQLSNVMQSKVGSADFNALKQRVDMQTLDSADINNMKTSGHYFVHNLANSPISGWVYVDVTGNGNDRIRQDVYQDNGIQHKYRRWFGTYWTGWEEGATYTEITQLQDAINLRVQKGELLSQINLTAGNTLIQTGKLYLDSSSVVFSGRAFIPSAAIASLNADKVNTGWLNTNNVNLGDGRTRIRADHDYMYIQPTGSAASNTGIRMGYSGLDFLTNVIPNGYSSSVPYYSVGYDGAANGYFKISAFDHINPGGTTASQLWYSMVPAISLNNQEINFAAKGNMHMQVVNGGVNIKPTLFFQNNTNNGTYAGFTRLDNSDTVEFNTGNNNGENFHVNSGARFMKYVYFNDYCRAQGWLTYSTLSKKTNIKKLDTSLALDKIRQDDQYLYEYKRNVAKGVYDPQASFIIDDVNDVSHYSVPREFIDQTGKYREPSVELSYLIAAFQEIDKQVQTQKEEIKELKEKLQHE
ncbi:chromosome partitioning protein ParA [Limosilactobacillus reuteri]|uniref:chromosome partitioning protein ParA n=1 Tax=Limosilactobacillus reuteri TaxID=1598 RepID=UPI001E524469|nr:chromosome partitioning protein ParA [Limosilactobacillus reuteri]MCC4467688.1 chromosome partitioning protein ParA [Limosilactobacillus reuteri]MCC4473782.1 chromosome partitioning protein ParA [Limosilactobacillus reuteri]